MGKQADLHSSCQHSQRLRNTILRPLCVMQSLAECLFSLRKQAELVIFYVELGSKHILLGFWGEMQKVDGNTFQGLG